MLPSVYDFWAREQSGKAIKSPNIPESGNGGACPGLTRAGHRLSAAGVIVMAGNLAPGPGGAIDLAWRLAEMVPGGIARAFRMALGGVNLVSHDPKPRGIAGAFRMARGWIDEVVLNGVPVKAFCASGVGRGGVYFVFLDMIPGGGAAAPGVSRGRVNFNIHNYLFSESSPCLCRPAGESLPGIALPPPPVRRVLFLVHGYLDHDLVEFPLRDQRQVGIFREKNHEEARLHRQPELGRLGEKLDVRFSIIFPGWLLAR